MVDQITSGGDPIASVVMQKNANLSVKIEVSVLNKVMDAGKSAATELLKGLGVGNNIDSYA